MSNKSSTFECLNPKVQNLINKYIDFRSKGGVIFYNNFKPKKHVSHKEINLQTDRNLLANTFFTIIVGRSNISVNSHNQLSYKTKKVVSEYDFYPLRVTKDDFFILSERYKTKTLTTIFASLKRFYYWILQDLQGEYIKDFEAVQEFRNTDNRITTFLSQFPSRNEIPSDEKIIKKEKSFLTRKQMIFVKNRLNNDPRSHKPHRDSVVWELCCVTGIRPTELPRIKIEYFNLDENGFLSLNNRNWGILDIPREISKQEQSPSHELYKTPIPFHTVLEINKYLKKVYRLQDKEIPKGKGYLFRPKLNDINKPYSGNFVKDSIKRIKHDLNFLTDKQKDDFELKASRRSLNNLIMGYNVECICQLKSEPYVNLILHHLFTF